MTRIATALLVALACACAIPPAYAEGPGRGRVARSHWLHRQVRHGQFPATAGVGTHRSWPTVDWDGGLVLREFELRALGPHVEIWTRAGDPRVESSECRSSNAADLVITTSQAQYMADQFERVIRPTEGKVFGVPRPRDGSHAQPEIVDPAVPQNAWRGDANRIVLLADNISSGGITLPEGIEATDRNYLIVRASAWATTLGAHPANLGPTPCRNHEGFAIPHEIESIVAHEYNHVIWYSKSPDPRGLWAVEGVADWSRWLTGYKDLKQDSLVNFVGIGCFEGRQAAMMPAGYSDPFGGLAGGPENSLSAWSEPGQSVFCDYGAAEAMTHLLGSRYGGGFLRDLLLGTGATDIDRLAKTLRRYRARQGVADTLKDWSTMMALDAVIDDGATLTGADSRRFQVRELHTSVNFDSPFAYSRPGAPPNGADFVRLRGANGRYYAADALRSLRFDAPSEYPSRPVEWAVDADGHGTANPALYSGDGGGGDIELDRDIVTSVTVDPSDPTLSFDIRYDTEPGYDFGYVQVSTDGGATFTSRPAQATTTEAASDAVAANVALLPGFNGDSGGWIHQTVDLADLAGSQILVAFRYRTDPWVTNPGVWVDDVRSGAALVSDGASLSGWSTSSQVHPRPIAGIGVRLVAYTGDHRKAWVADIPLNARNHGSLNAARLHDLVGKQATTVAALVTHYEPTEAISAGAPYQLKVNDVVQPGG